MATVALVAVIVGVVASALLVAAVVMVAVQRVRRAVDDASRSLGRLAPLVAELDRQQQVSTGEIARIQNRVDTLVEERATRRR